MDKHSAGPSVPPQSNALVGDPDGNLMLFAGEDMAGLNLSDPASVVSKRAAVPAPANETNDRRDWLQARTPSAWPRAPLRGARPLSGKLIATPLSRGDNSG
jgi:hypothetical protein